LISFYPLPSFMLSRDYRLPAEYEHHRATWLLWPTRPDNWRCGGYFAQNDVLSLAALIAHFEPVRIGAPSTLIETLRRRVPANISVVSTEFDDTWIRDTGPMVLVAKSKRPVAVDWRFNSWGGLFSNATADNLVASAVAQFEKLDVISAPMVMEGGAITSDGHGTIIVTEESVLADNRNPGLTRADAEEVFRHFLNVQNVIWLPYGLCHDEAGGHVDNVCAFAPNRIILLAATEDQSHPSYERLRFAKERLATAQTAKNQPFSIVPVPLPSEVRITAEEAEGFAKTDGTIIRQTGSLLAPSHINFYATGGAVFVPTFNGTSDQIAEQIIGRAFPGRRIIPYHSREFLLGGGAIHCLTREIPA
jgi:agmatine deiminase